MKTFLCREKNGCYKNCVVTCFIGSPLQPAGVSYISCRAHRHLTVFGWGGFKTHFSHRFMEAKIPDAICLKPPLPCFH